MTLTSRGWGSFSAPTLRKASLSNTTVPSPAETADSVGKPLRAPSSFLPVHLDAKMEWSASRAAAGAGKKRSNVVPTPNAVSTLIETPTCFIKAST